MTYAQPIVKPWGESSSSSCESYTFVLNFSTKWSLICSGVLWLNTRWSKSAESVVSDNRIQPIMTICQSLLPECKNSIPPQEIIVSGMRRRANSELRCSAGNKSIWNSAPLKFHGEPDHHCNDTARWRSILARHSRLGRIRMENYGVKKKRTICLHSCGSPLSVPGLSYYR